ncbi:lytic transglycosylase domain-containing protein [Neolewinella aurantiaca]|uniref:Lytic transglycosylase domain-containing protein n=1 Tax=Neolewinella aurantiaca TaxID=2602767 RepID=A0A5C7FY68_9BACT|nr:lytic transglycosylase domain-containing protein [Neolewinella aurantiaca]TXF91791.1 lytic transglycosylase domain-containing protein [Neolewinella aurantiaca]
MKHLLTGLGIGIVFLTGWLVLLSSERADTTGGPSFAQEMSSADNLQLPQRVRGVDLDGPFTFAGETIPVDNFDVRERLDQELLRNAYFHRNTIMLLKRQQRYFPTIERILAEEGVPDDLKYLAVAESGLSNATSVAGAKGVWQFMTPTGKGFGLEINGEVDERYHLEKATRAACKYLKGYYETYKDWRWVAAAYNMGGPNVNKWKSRQQAETVFELDINSETMAYLFRIVALKTILKDPLAFGYEISPEEHYPPLDSYKSITITKSIPDLADFAKQQGTSYRMLKVYNPWLISGSLTVSSGNSYEVKIPV